MTESRAQSAESPEPPPALPHRLRRRVARWVALASALVAVALLAFFWRDILHAVVPESQLWGRWELVETSTGRPTGATRYVVEFTPGGQRRTTARRDGEDVSVVATVYSVSGPLIHHHDSAGRRRDAPERFRIEEDGALVITNSVGNEMRFERAE